jgi:hypothetical protein
MVEKFVYQAIRRVLVCLYWKENVVTIAHELGSMSSCSGQCTFGDPHSDVALIYSARILISKRCWQREAIGDLQTTNHINDKKLLT